MAETRTMSISFVGKKESFVTRKTAKLPFSFDSLWRVNNERAETRKWENLMLMTLVANVSFSSGMYVNYDE